MKMDNNQLKCLCRQVRRDVINMVTDAGSGHPGGSLSCVELIACAFSQMRTDNSAADAAEKDSFVLSKGHCAPAYYSVLAHMGYFDVSELSTLRKLNSRLQGHPDSKKCPGVDVATGSLGQGVSLAVGLALGAKYQNKDSNVFVLTGDGELQEGQVWEAFMSANHYKLDNLTVMIDWNGLQIDGANDEVMSLGDLPAKMNAFGFEVFELEDGNDVEQVLDAIKAPAEGKPKCIIAHTVKGKGVSFMENQVGWHGKAPNEEQRQSALKELEG